MRNERHLPYRRLSYFFSLFPPIFGVLRNDKSRALPPFSFSLSLSLSRARALTEVSSGDLGDVVLNGLEKVLAERSEIFHDGEYPPRKSG